MISIGLLYFSSGMWTRHHTFSLYEHQFECQVHNLSSDAPITQPNTCSSPLRQAACWRGESTTQGRPGWRGRARLVCPGTITRCSWKWGTCCPTNPSLRTSALTLMETTFLGVSRPRGAPACVTSRGNYKGTYIHLASDTIESYKCRYVYMHM